MRHLNFSYFNYKHRLFSVLMSCHIESNIFNPDFISGASRRLLMLDKIVWVAGWPTITDGVPSLMAQDGPVF